MEVEWTIEAQSWLKEIHDYIAQDSPQRAEAFILRLVAAVGRLETFSLSGPVLAEDTRYRQLTISGYRVLYRLTGERVRISAVLSPGMLIENALQKFQVDRP